MSHPNTPDFKSWSHENLVKFASDVYNKLLEVECANEQLRLDNKDLSEQVRKFLRKDPSR